MVQLLLLLTGALVVGAIVFGVAALITGGEALGEVEPDGRSMPLPSVRPLHEADLTSVRFDTALRGYRMDQVDQALRRAAYDIGYKSELIQVLEAEITALREGRIADADGMRASRIAALAGEEDVPDPADQHESSPLEDAARTELESIELESTELESVAGPGAVAGSGAAEDAVNDAAVSLVSLAKTPDSTES